MKRPAPKTTLKTKTPVKSRRQAKGLSRATTKRVDSGKRANGAAFYRAVIDHLRSAAVPFLVGGADAVGVYAGIVRRTKDFDIFLQQQDVGRCLQVLANAGYRTELTFPHWLGKAYRGAEFVDVIFSSGNGLCRVDSEWFQHCRVGRVLGWHLKLCPVEELIWQKCFVLERDRCDTADVSHLLRNQGEALDWQRLLSRFGDFWRPLLAQIILFDFVYPSHHRCVPEWVRQRLWTLGESDRVPPADSQRRCYGTLLSASQYLRDIDCEGYQDMRLPPTGQMTPEQIAIWTANFMHH